MASTSAAAASMDDLVGEFCKITGAEESVAKNMLEACNNNLEMAINMHVDSSMINNAKAPLKDNVRPPIPPTRGILVQDDYFLTYQTPRRTPRSVFDAFRDFQEEARIQEEEVQNLDSKVVKKKKTLEDLFRPPLDIMHRASFESARDQGRSENKWLMVNVQDVQEFSCQVLNRDVWSNPTVKSFIKENFIFWQVYCDSQEGKRYVHFYNVNQFPYIAILDPRTGEKLVVWHRVDSITLCDLMSDFITKHPSPSGCSNSPKRKRYRPEGIVDESEEKQLWAAIEASLKENGTKSDESTDDSDIEIQESTSSPLPKKKIQKETIVTNGESFSKASNSVPLSTTQPPVESLEDWKQYIGHESDPKSEIMLRFPSGDKEKITFPSTSKLKALLLYCSSMGYPKETYELVTNFPRKDLTSMDNNATLKELNIFPRETIFIQHNSR